MDNQISQEEVHKKMNAPFSNKIQITDYSDINQIPEISDSDLAFGSVYINGGMPENETLPEEFQNTKTKWHKLFNHLFYNGGEKVEMDMRDDFKPEDGQKYYRFISSIMKSYGPKHQHKENACAWLFSQWVKDWEIKK